MLEKSQRNIFKVALQYLPDQILIYVYCKSKESMSNEGVKQKLLELQNEIVKTVEHSKAFTTILKPRHLKAVELKIFYQR